MMLPRTQLAAGPLVLAQLLLVLPSLHGFLLPATPARAHLLTAAGVDSHDQSTSWAARPEHRRGRLRHLSSSSISLYDAAEGAELQWWDDDTQLKALRIPCSDYRGNSVDPSSLMQFLMEVGALSATAEDAARGTAQETPILHEHDASLGLEPRWDNIVGRAEYWANTTVTAHFPREWELQGTIDMIEQVFELPCPLSFSVDDIADEDWVRSVQQTWHPIHLGRLRIRFPWHDPLPPREEGGQVELCLDGGRAFGTGEHPTTRMCCLWLEQSLAQNPGARVLDYGSGSGLLGFAALKFGASEAVGVEVDVDAILSSLYNAELNGLAMTFYHPREVLTPGGAVERVQLRRIDAAPPDSASSGVSGYVAGPVIEQWREPFDLTVANILAGCLVRTEAAIAAMTRSGGRLAMSGVLHYQADQVVEAYSRDFRGVRVAQRDGEWVLITATRR